MRYDLLHEERETLAAQAHRHARAPQLAARTQSASDPDRAPCVDPRGQRPGSRPGERPGFRPGEPRA